MSTRAQKAVKTLRPVRRARQTLPRKSRRSVWFLCTLSGLAASLAGQSVDGPIELDRGAHDVGWRVIDLLDESREYRPAPSDGKAGRPFRAALWYPALVFGDDRNSTYGDYVTVAAEPGVADEQAKQSFLSGGGRSNEVAREWWDIPVDAFRDAPPEDGRFALLLYAASFNASAFENTLLCEYLASHGYCVLACPSIGHGQRQMTTDPAGIEAQTQDLQFLLDWAREQPGVDVARVGVAGYSWGGLTQFLLALREPTVRALVALDGSIGYPVGLEPAERIEGFSPESLTASFVHLAQGTTHLRDGPALDTRWFEQAERVNRGFLRFAALHHGHFSSHTIVRTVVLGSTPDSVIAERIYESYATLCRVTREYFDAEVKGSADVVEWLGRITEPGAVFSNPELGSVSTRHPSRAPR